MRRGCHGSWSFGLAIAAALLATPSMVLGQTAPAAKHLRLGIVISKESPLGSFATTMTGQVKEASKGGLVIDLFDRGQLGAETEMLNNVRQGTLDLTLIGSPIVAQVEANFGVTELPFLWKDGDTMFSVLNAKLGDDMLASLESKGLKGIAFGDSGPRSLLTRNKPVNSVDDVRGLKVRVVENKLYVANWRNMGANPVPMAWTEVYTGLQQGTIDAVDSTPWGTREAKHFEVAKNIALTNHVYTAYVLVMNLDQWRALSAEQQKILKDAALAGQKVNREQIGKDNSSAVEMMRKAGVTVTTPDRASFVAKIAPVYEQFASSINPDILKRIQDANK